MTNWGPKAAIKESDIQKVTEDAARLAALESGQADFINNVPDHEVPRLKKTTRAFASINSKARGCFSWRLNFAFKPWDNKLVRQAANYSVDAPAIVRNIFDGIGYPCNGPWRAMCWAPIPS
jgi:ABC-type transport system substrate-binding protein